MSMILDVLGIKLERPDWFGNAQRRGGGVIMCIEGRKMLRLEQAAGSPDAE